MSVLSENLDAIRRELLSWTTWNVEQRRREGLTTENDTAIISVPPNWPTHGVIRNWAAVLQEAQRLSFDARDALRRENVSLNRRINIMDGEIARTEQANREMAQRCEKLTRENAEMKAALASIGRSK